jgi:hypothetical protein
MTNDKTRMTNGKSSISSPVEASFCFRLGNSTFVILSTFGFRHSSFPSSLSLVFLWPKLGLERLGGLRILPASRAWSTHLSRGTVRRMSALISVGVGEMLPALVAGNSPDTN